MRDNIKQLKVLGSLPPNVTLLHSGDVYDQGDLGSATACASAMAFSLHFGLPGPPSLSLEDLYLKGRGK